MKIVTLAAAVIALSYSSVGAALCLPWNGTAQTEIDSSDDAWNHWNSRAGGSIPAGTGLYSIIKNSPQYTSYVSSAGDLPKSIAGRLASVPSSATSGYIDSGLGGYRGWDSEPLGAYKMEIRYTGNWSAARWISNRRTVTGTFVVEFSFSDSWDFTKNDNYTFWQNLNREYLPAIIAGCGKAFSIYGSFNIQYTVTTTQVRNLG